MRPPPYLPEQYCQTEFDILMLASTLSHYREATHLSDFCAAPIYYADIHIKLIYMRQVLIFTSSLQEED